MIAVCVILCASSSKYFPQLFFFTLSLNNLFDFNLFHFSKYKADPLFVTCRNGSSPTYLLIERLLVSFFIQEERDGQNKHISALFNCQLWHFLCLENCFSPRGALSETQQWKTIHSSLPRGPVYPSIVQETTCLLNQRAFGSACS